MNSDNSVAVPTSTIRLREEEKLGQEWFRNEDTGKLSPVLTGGPDPEDIDNDEDA